MQLRSPISLAGAFLTLALAYSVYFNVVIRTDANAARSRFDVLVDANAPRRAARHGERALGLYGTDKITATELAQFKIELADAQFSSTRYRRAADLYRDGLAAQWGEALGPHERAPIEDLLARSLIQSGELLDGVAIYASFIEMAGDAASRSEPTENETATMFADFVADAGPLFASVFNYASLPDYGDASEAAQLAAAEQLADLGSFFTMRGGGEYAAAGLFAAGHEIRARLLGEDHPDTIQLTTLLGPALTQLGRLEEAEKLYLNAFHAQERIKGSNSPDLSFYIKLLAGIYEQQGRMTEAQALYEHMRKLFQDAFGAQRYSVNRERDRRADFNRPVSQYFLLEPEYAPSDLIAASSYTIPTSKSPSIDEMKLRLAPDVDADSREANLPVRLAQLISLCRTESGEDISLRSGYRSYETQEILFDRNGARGLVTPPGMSEHQTGLAADINVNGRFMRQSDRAYQCFEENAFRYGFILSYPPGNDYLPNADSHEPWHWRYVGLQTAQLYREAGPLNKPQEFLAALPCYEERAASGIFPTAGEPDICMTGPQPVTVAATESDPLQPQSEMPNSARILNNAAGTQARR